MKNNHGKGETKKSLPSLRRPAVFFVIPFASGIIVSALTGIPIFWAFVFVLIALSVSVLVFIFRSNYSKWFVYIALFAGGFFIYSTVNGTVPNDDPSSRFSDYKPVSATIIGTVADDPQRYGDGVSFKLDIESIASYEYSGTAGGYCRVSIYDDIPLEYGDRVELCGDISRPTPPKYDNGFDYASYLKTRGIRTVLKMNDASGVKLLGRGKVNPLYLVSYDIKHYVGRSIEESVGGRSAKLIKGLLIGTRGEIAIEERDYFTAAGVVHILAISGQNVNLIAFLLFLVLSGSQIPRKWVTLIVMVFLPLYAIISGLDPPVIRATLMGEIVLVAYFVQRKADLINVLSAAALILLASNPLLISDASFLLSYAACFGLAIGFKPTTRRLTKIRVPKFIREGIAATVSAQLGVLPLQLYYFHRISPISFLSNLFVVPLAALASIIGFISVIIGAIAPPLARLYGATGWLVGEVVFRITEVFAGGLKPVSEYIGFLPPVIMRNLDLQFWFGRPNIIILIAIAAVTVFIFVRKPTVRKVSAIIVVAGAIVAGILFGISSKDDNLEVVFLPMGNADSCIIITPNDKVILIDSGYGKGDYSAGRSIIAPFLHSRGLDRIDLMCITDTYPTCSGGAAYLSENIPISQIWYPSSKDNSQYDIWQPDSNIPANTFGERSTFKVDGVSLTALSQSSVDEKNASGYVPALRIEYDDFDILYACQPRPNISLLTSGRETTDPPPVILKAPRRGTGKDIDASLLSAINPGLVILSSKSSGDFRYPDINLTTKLNNSEVPYLCTGEHGAITISVDEGYAMIKSAY